MQQQVEQAADEEGEGDDDGDHGQRDLYALFLDHHHQAGLVDELLLYQAPVILGTDARGMFAGAALTVLNNASQWRIVERRILGTDSFFRTRRADESARRA